MTWQRLKVKALLIDLDGTLVDATDALVEAAKRAFASIGLCCTSPRIGVEIARQLQSDLPLDNMLHKSGIAGAMKRRFVTAYLKSFYNLTLKKTKPIPKVNATLHMLSRHRPLALITRRNISQEQLEKELRRLRFIRYFKAILTSQDVNQPQPSPEILLKAAEKLGVSINRCAVVTDSIVDIQAGKAAGIKTIAVLSGLFSREELEKWKPDFIIDNINYLPDLLSVSERDLDNRNAN